MGRALRRVAPVRALRVPDEQPDGARDPRAEQRVHEAELDEVVRVAAGRVDAADGRGDEDDRRRVVDRHQQDADEQRGEAEREPERAMGAGQLDQRERDQQAEHRAGDPLQRPLPVARRGRREHDHRGEHGPVRAPEPELARGKAREPGGEPDPHAAPEQRVARVEHRAQPVPERPLGPARASGELRAPVAVEHGDGHGRLVERAREQLDRPAAGRGGARYGARRCGSASERRGRGGGDPRPRCEGRGRWCAAH